MLLLYILIAVVAIIINVVIASKFAEIAEMKGHEHDTYFWFTFIFGVIGMLMVIALPDMSNTMEDNANKNADTQVMSPTNARASAPPVAGNWKCTCGRVNASYVSTCACGRSKHDIAK